MRSKSILIRRAVAFLIDVFMLLIPTILLWYVVTMAISGSDATAATRKTYTAAAFPLIMLVFVSLKDVLGRSPGKKLMRLRIISITGKPKVSVLCRIVRNVTFIVWPIELIVIALTGIRLTDRILGLTVSYSHFE